MEVKERFLSKNEKLSYGLLWVVGAVIYETDMQHGDGRVFWPFHPCLLNGLVAPWVYSEFYRILNKLKRMGFDRKRIARIIYSPTKLATYQYLWPTDTLRVLPRYKKIWLLSEFSSLLNLMRNGEPFCENFRNVVWKELKIDRSRFLSKEDNKGFFKILSELELYLVYYSELLNYWLLDFSRFYHGPYESGNEKVFVKEFLLTKAAERYDFLSDFPFDHYQQIGIYSKEVEIKVFFSGHTHISKPFPEAIEKTLVKLDGNVVDDKRTLAWILKKVKACYTKLLRLLKNADETFLIRHGIDTFFYHMKPLYQSCGESWKKILPKVYRFAEREKNKMRIPNPWGDWDAYKATKFLFKRSWRIINERPISRKGILFMKKLEKIARKIPTETPSYSLIRALSKI